MNRGEVSSDMTSLVNRKEFEYEISYNPINSVIGETPEERVDW